MSEAEVAERRSHHQGLLAAATPTVDRLKRELYDSGYAVVITDASGCGVLDITAEEHAGAARAAGVHVAVRDRDRGAIRRGEVVLFLRSAPTPELLPVAARAAGRRCFVS